MKARLTTGTAAAALVVLVTVAAGARSTQSRIREFDQPWRGAWERL